MNYFSYPSEVPAEHASCAELVNTLGGFDVIDNIARLNQITGLFEHCDSSGGMDFPIISGEAYVVNAIMDNSLVWFWTPVCPSIPLNAGVNLIGHPGTPADLSCYSWLEAQAPGLLRQFSDLILILADSNLA